MIIMGYFSYFSVKAYAVDTHKGSQRSVSNEHMFYGELEKIIPEFNNVIKYSS